MTPKRRSHRYEVTEVRSRYPTQIADRITLSARKASPQPGPMTARMAGIKLIRGVPHRRLAGRMTSGQRMSEMKRVMLQERIKEEKAQRDVLRRRVTGLGPSALERFAEEPETLLEQRSTGVREKTRHDARPLRPSPLERFAEECENRQKQRSTGVREKTRHNVRKCSGVDTDGFLEIVMPTKGREVKATQPSSGYGVLLGSGRKTSPSRTKKRPREKRPPSGSSKRRKGEEQVKMDVIDLSGFSQDDRTAPSEARFRLKKKRPNPTKMVALPASVFSPQIGGSPTGPKRPATTNKPIHSKRTGGGSCRRVLPMNNDVVLDVDCCSRSDDQTGDAVEVIASFSDQEVSPESLCKTHGEKSPTVPSTTPGRQKKPRQSGLVAAPPRHGKTDAPHSGTSPMPVARKGSAKDASNATTSHKPFVRCKKQTMTPVPIVPPSSSAQRTQSSAANSGIRKQVTIRPRIRPMPAFPAVLEDDGETSEEVQQVFDDSESDVVVIPSCVNNDNAKRTANDGSIPTTTFYETGSRTRSKTRKSGTTTPGICPRSKVRNRKPKKSTIVCSEDEDDNEMECSPQRDIRFRSLSKEELDEYKSLTVKGPEHQVMATIKEANIELRSEDFSRLRGSRWLSDEIINAFVALINSRNSDFFESPDVDAFASKLFISGAPHANEASRVRDPEYRDDAKPRAEENLDIFERSRPRVHIFNTFFFARLTQGSSYDYQGVRRWLKRAGRDVSSLDLIMFPINIINLHWVLAAIDLRGKKFLYFDSTYGGDSLDALGTLRRWLKDEVLDKCGKDVFDAMDIDSWDSEVNPSYLPQQRDHGSCGIFTLYMAEYLERGVCPNFKQKNILTLRKRTALFLKHGKLP